MDWKFWKRFGWSGKPDRREADCPDCVRLGDEEEDAAIAFLAEEAKNPTGASRARLQAARDQLKAHRNLHHPAGFASVRPA